MGLIDYSAHYSGAIAILELTKLNPDYLKKTSESFPVGTNWEFLIYTLVDLSMEVESVREPSLKSRLRTTISDIEHDLELLLSGKEPCYNSWKNYDIDVTGGIISFYRALILEVEKASRTPGSLVKLRGKQHVGAVIERGLDLVDLFIARTTEGQLRFHITTGVVETKRLLRKLEERDRIARFPN